jgi:signal transduction histidine kinase
LQAVVEGLSSIAALDGIELAIEGESTATICVPEPRLRLALQYLLTATIQAAPANSKVRLRLEEGSSESALRVQRERRIWFQDDGVRTAQSRRDPVSTSLSKVRVAIASRVLETAGAFLAFEDGQTPGFVLRVPRWLATSSVPA